MLKTEFDFESKQEWYNYGKLNYITSTNDDCYYYDEESATGYLNFEPIYNLKRYKKRYCFHDNLNYDVDCFIDDYLIEARKKQKKNSDKKNIEAYKLTYLLPRQILKLLSMETCKSIFKKLEGLSNEIISQIAPAMNLKFFCYLKTCRNGVCYLVIICFDRYFYKHGRVVTRKRSSTFYQDEQGKRISEKDYNKEKHSVKWKQGDSYKKRIYVSDKIRFTDFFTNHNAELFKDRLNLLKQKLAIKVSNLFQIKMYEVPEYIKKLSYKRKVKSGNKYTSVEYVSSSFNKRYYWNRRRVKAINDYIDKVNAFIPVFCLNDERRLKQALELANDKIHQAKTFKLAPEVENYLKIETDLVEEIFGF